MLAAVSLALAGCDIDKPTPHVKEGFVAIVYADLTRSINDETANRIKRNVAELFRNTPPNTNFYLFSVDRGTSKPDIYEFIPHFSEIKLASDEDKVKKEMEDNQKTKADVELKKLKDSLDSYHALIASQKGPVSCLTNKLNSLSDMIRNKSSNYPDYEIRVYFYSDMIEDCSNSFDGKPLAFKRSANDDEEEKHLQDIQHRIDKNFHQVELKSLHPKVYVVLTSQDDKQSLANLKMLWSKFFDKLGVDTGDIFWGVGNEESFWKMPK